MNLKETANGLKRDVPAVFLALKAKETPWSAKLFAALTVAYALSPVDLIPDFIPLLGYLDDLLLLPLLVALTVKFIPRETFEKYRTEAEAMWSEETPQKWYYALPIIVVWAFLVYYVVKLVV